MWYSTGIVNANLTALLIIGILSMNERGILKKYLTEEATELTEIIDG